MSLSVPNLGLALVAVLLLASLVAALTRHPQEARGLLALALRLVGRLSLFRHSDAPGRLHLPGTAQPAPPPASLAAGAERLGRARRTTAPGGLPLKALLALSALGFATACTARALLLQREAVAQLRSAAALERTAAGHLRTHATACREAAAAAEAAAYAGFPAASPAALRAAAEMRRDCAGLPAAALPGVDSAPGPAVPDAGVRDAGGAGAAPFSPVTDGGSRG